MYNFKEKKLHFNALRNPDAAAFDLELLQKISPSHPNLRTFSRDAKRYGNDILYALLDVVSREEIRAFRRAKQEEALQPIPSLEETKECADEAEQRAEEAEEAQEEAEQRAEEAEERADAAESALEEEKKKEPTAVAPAKSKSTKSTRKSTGTTSSTSKSK